MSMLAVEEERVERIEYRLDVLEGKEYVKQTCGSCKYPYWRGGDPMGICERCNDEEVWRQQKACKRWSNE